MLRERERLEAIAKEERRQQALEMEITRRTDSVRKERLLKTVPLWHKVERIREYVAAVRDEALRRTCQIEAESEFGRWLRWAEQYVEFIAPLGDRHELPPFSLTLQQLDQIKRECEADWQSIRRRSAQGNRGSILKRLRYFPTRVPQKRRTM